MTEYSLTDADGTVRWRGTIDPAPGGGSQATLVQQTITAAEIAAAWDNGNSNAAIQLGGIAAGDVAAVIWESPGSTLDQNVVLDSTCMAYLPGQTTVDVQQNGESLVTRRTMGAGGTYGIGSSNAVVGFFQLLAGAVFYALFIGDAAPTTGETTVNLPAWLA